MPRLTERDRLEELEARERKAIDEAETARRNLREKYADVLRDMTVERISEREFRDVISHAIRVGGGACVAALKAIPDAMR